MNKLTRFLRSSLSWGLVFVLLLLTAACAQIVSSTGSENVTTDTAASYRDLYDPETTLPDNPNEGLVYDPENLREIVLAGGCFWGVDAYLSRLYGVADTESAYANGHTENPSYEEVCDGNTGYAEAVKVSYDPARISLAALLEQFFSIINPTQINRQGMDIGDQYRNGIYYTDREDLKVIELVMDEVQQNYRRPLATEVELLTSYYPAEAYHQDYLEKNPNGYCHVSFAGLPSGEVESTLDSIVDQLPPAETPTPPDPDTWVRPDDEELRQLLTAMQYQVTQKEATEQPFYNEYNDETRPGLYVDVVSGEPLFTSDTKYDSNCGWPSFTGPVSEDALVELPDDSHGMERIEIRSAIADSHLGHVFNDGPEEAGGLRYCMNSAAMRFIPWEELEYEGYGEWQDKITHPDKNPNPS